MSIPSRPGSTTKIDPQHHPLHNTRVLVLPHKKTAAGGNGLHAAHLGEGCHEPLDAFRVPGIHREVGSPYMSLYLFAEPEGLYQGFVAPQPFVQFHAQGIGKAILNTEPAGDQHDLQDLLVRETQGL